jgi:hypothetical protein
MKYIRINVTKGKETFSLAKQESIVDAIKIIKIAISKGYAISNIVILEYDDLDDGLISIQDAIYSELHERILIIAR